MQFFHQNKYLYFYKYQEKMIYSLLKHFAIIKIRYLILLLNKALEELQW